LANAKEVSLSLADNSLRLDYQPEAGLLGRSCRQAHPGLHLNLWVEQPNKTALLQLLQPAVNAGGHSSVHELVVRVTKQAAKIPRSKVIEEAEMTIVVSVARYTLHMFAALLSAGAY
jgi:hypothetical protein